LYDGEEPVGTERNDEDADAEPVTELNVDVDPSLIAEITISRTGESAIIVSSDQSSPADSEPRTIEPQTLQPNLSVRGLAPRPAAGAPLSDAPATPHRVPFQTDEYEDDDEDATTSKNIEAKLIHAFSVEQRAKQKSALGFGPVITPSEPFRVTSLESLEITTSAKKLSSASLLAARATDTDLGEPTVKLVPHEEDVEEDETVTDAMRTLGPADLDEDDALPVTEDCAGVPEDDEEPPDSKTEVAAPRGAIIGSVTVAMDDRPRESDEVGNEGHAGTMRMAFPKATSELIYEAVARSATAPATNAPGTDPLLPPVQANAGPPPPVAQLPPPQAPTIPPAGFAGPSAPAEPPAKKRRGAGRVIAVFFILALLGGGGVALFKSKHRPAWLARVAGVPSVAPSVPAPSASASTSSTSSVASSSASADAHDGGIVAALMASASASASASAAPSTSASTAPTTSASGRGRRNRPRR
jgi:hypothetical protein